MSGETWEKSGAALREMRKKTGLSIFKAAKRLHISGNYLSLLERGKNAPSDTVIFNIAEFYNIDPCEIFKLYNRVTPPTNEKLTSMPMLKKIMTEISTDERLTHEEKEEFANRVYQIANDLYGG